MHPCEHVVEVMFNSGIVVVVAIISACSASVYAVFNHCRNGRGQGQCMKIVQYIKLNKQKIKQETAKQRKSKHFKATKSINIIKILACF